MDDEIFAEKSLKVQHLCGTRPDKVPWPDALAGVYIPHALISIRPPMGCKFFVLEFAMYLVLCKTRIGNSPSNKITRVSLCLFVCLVH